MNTVVFDVETQRSFDEVGGRHNIRKMGLSAAVTYSTADGTFHRYAEEDAADLIAKGEISADQNLSAALTRDIDGLLAKRESTDRPGMVLFVTDGLPTIGQSKRKWWIMSLANRARPTTINPSETCRAYSPI